MLYMLHALSAPARVLHYASGMHVASVHNECSMHAEYMQHACSMCVG